LEKKAHLVALIGLDGSGKTTQADLLTAWLRDRGHAVVLHPNESLQPVKRVLTDIARDSGYQDLATMLGVDTAQLMIAILKWNTMAKVEPFLGCEGQFVVMDRYGYCQVAAANYLGIEAAWLVERLYSSFPAPDLTMFLEIDPQTALRRLEARNSDVIPLPLSFLEGHRSAYRQLPDARRFVSVDASRSVEEVRDEIRRHVEARFPFLA
jgi:dTMP kinase